MDCNEMDNDFINVRTSSKSDTRGEGGEDCAVDQNNGSWPVESSEKKPPDYSEVDIKDYKAEQTEKDVKETDHDTECLLSPTSRENDYNKDVSAPKKLMPSQVTNSKYNEPVIEHFKNEEPTKGKNLLLQETDIADNLLIEESESNTTKIITTFQLTLNAFVAYCWIGPLVVIFWVSTWMLICTIILVPHRPTLSAWCSAAIGYGIYIIAACTQHKIRDFALRHGKVVRYVTSRMFTYVVALACINQWRSIWDLWEIYTGVSPVKGAIYSSSCMMILVILGCCRQALSPPALIALDFPIASYFEISTYRKMKVGSFKQILDSVFSALVVCPIVVGMWRGLWELYDTALYPDAPNISAGLCLIISYTLSGLLIITRNKMAKLTAWAQRKHRLLHLAVEDSIIILHAICCISHWRGYWILYDMYILEPPLRYWVGHVTAFVLLTSIMASNSLLTRGCARDCELPSGQGVILDFHYVTKLVNGFRLRNMRKNEKKLLAMESSVGVGDIPEHGGI